MHDEDFVEHLFVTSTHSSLLYFTNKGRVFRGKCYAVPESGKAAKGTAIVNLLQLGEGEKVTAILPIRPEETEGYIVMATRSGTIKKTPLDAFDNIRKTGLIAIDLREDDELITAELSCGKDEFIIASRSGRCLRFDEAEVRPMGRTAAGVRAIDLEDGDRVVDMLKVVPGGEVVTISELGIGKHTPVEQYNSKHRGGKGYSAMELNEKTGELCGIKIFTGESDLMMIKDDGIMIRFNLADVRVSGRNTQGVKLMRVDSGRVAAISLVPHQEGEETEIPEETVVTAPDGEQTAEETEK